MFIGILLGSPEINGGSEAEQKEESHPPFAVADLAS